LHSFFSRVGASIDKKVGIICLQVLPYRQQSKFWQISDITEKKVKIKEMQKLKVTVPI